MSLWDADRILAIDKEKKEDLRGIGGCVDIGA